MSDATLALLITVLGLLALAAWVPLLHAAETLTIRLTEGKTSHSTQEEEAFKDRKTA